VPAPPLLTAADPLPERPDPAILLVDKPKGLTSFDVIRRLRKRFGIKKMGHAGTLDPMATGLLVVLIGRDATRLQDQFMALPKVYTGTLRLGETTPSQDAESEVSERRDPSGVTDEDLDRARAALEGEIRQIPPMYSAVKVGGERLYAKARRGEEIERESRPVSIYSFALTGRSGTDVDFRVVCSKGTYIRTLAADLGEAVGVGAHLVALRREAIGPFGVGEAWGLDALTADA
jgi:tRNA pseudouridine55 synthase